MSDALIASLWVGSVLLTASLSGFVVWLYQQRRQLNAQRELAELKTRLLLEREHREQQQHDQTLLSNHFAALSQSALNQNTDTFLKLAQEKLAQFQLQSQSDQGERKQAIETLLKPIQEALLKTERQIGEIEKDRKESFGALSQHLAAVARAQENLQGETRNLVSALRRPEVRGQWGELTLKRVVELAGMVEYCDFYEQSSVVSDTGSIRPDMIVRLPGGRDIVVDVKTPMDAYLNAVEATDETVRQTELLRHARQLRERVRELSAKKYWQNLEHTPDFVVLFIPGEQFLSAALEQDHGLIEAALEKKVIIATPTTLVALLRAVAYGWRQHTLERNTDQIRDLGRELYKRLHVFTEHLSRVGKNLGGAVDSYNKAVGSLERQVLTGARRLEELGVNTGESIENLEPIDQTVRELQVPPGLNS